MVVEQGIHGELVEISPVSVYQGRTRTQNVRVQLDDGTEIVVSDPKKKCSEELVGTDVQMDVYVNAFSDVESSGEAREGISPLPTRKGPYANVCGEIDNIVHGGSEPSVHLRFDNSSIEIDVTEHQMTHFEGFDEGDTICLKNGKLYLDAISV